MNSFTIKNDGMVIKVRGIVGSIKAAVAVFTANSLYFRVALQVLHQASGNNFALGQQLYLWR